VLRRPTESTQYVSIRYTERLAEAGIEPSVGSVGDSYDCEYVGAARRV
jgi:putative transposase